jgi:uncharacterized protein
MQAVLTSEVHVIPVLAEGYIVYAPLRRTAFIGNAYIAARLRGRQPGEVLAFAEEDSAMVEFLRSLEILDGPGELAPRTAPAGPPRPIGVTLLLTTACTMRCRYCYASAGDGGTKHMGIETARRGIAYVVRNAVEMGEPHAEIAFHGGGEPTVNWETLCAAAEYARRLCAEHGIGCNIALATNGVLNSRQIAWIAANLDGLTVSFDGLPAVHDANRVLAGGGPSSARVLETLHQLDALHVHYAIRATVTVEHIPLLPESVRFIYTRSRPRSVQVEPVYRMGRGADAEIAETGGFIKAFRAAREIARELGGGLAFSAARIGALTDHFCAATRDSFCLSADGNVTSCYEVFAETHTWAAEFFYGSPDEGGGYRYDMERVERLRAQSVHNRDFCRGCFARWTCGGDCYHKALVTNGRVPIRGAGRCDIIRELSKDMLLDCIADAGGVLWREGGIQPKRRDDDVR